MLIQIQEPGETLKSTKTGAIVGIDFGTTHSVVAISRDKNAIIIPIEGERLTPSIVAFNKAEYLVGHDAEKKSHSKIIRSIKKYMELTNLSSQKLSNEFGQPAIKESEKTPIQIASHILEYLKIEAEKSLGEPITGAVITVPAYYSEIAREATRMAAQLAGIPVLRLLSEPTAAALAYRLDEQEEGDYLLYDLGGGTFDVSVLRLEKGIFQVLSVRGDMALGGDDVDASLFAFLNVKISTSKGLLLARNIKEHLTSYSFWEGTVKGKDIKIYRKDLNSLLDCFIKRTLVLCQKALSDAEVSKNNLKAVVLVGGSTRMPYLQDQVEQFFGQKPLSSLNPDEVVALGASLHAESLKTGKGKLLLDVTPFSLGIETLGGSVEILIPRNAPLPGSVSEQFTTSYDGQTKIKIHIVQGNSRDVKGCRSLATFILGNIPPLPAGQVQLKVIFTLDADGILFVHAEEENTKIQHSIQVRPSIYRN